MSPVSPLSIAPGTRQNVSQIDGVRPSSATAPSIWYADVATPQRNPAGSPATRSALMLIFALLGNRNAAREPARDRTVGVVAGRRDPQHRDLFGTTVERLRAPRMERTTGRHAAQVR